MIIKQLYKEFIATFTIRQIIELRKELEIEYNKNGKKIELINEVLQEKGLKE